MTGTGRQWDWTAEGWQWSSTMEPQSLMKQGSDERTPKTDRDAMRDASQNRDVEDTREPIIKA